MSKWGFFIGLCVGVLILALLLVLTALHVRCRALFDDDAGDDIMSVTGRAVRVLLLDRLLEKWSWEPYESRSANIAVGVLHVISIAIAVPAAVGIFLCYVMFFAMGFSIGAVACLSAWPIVKGVFYGLCILLKSKELGSLPSLRIAAIESGIVTVYIAHILLVGIFLSWITEVLYAGLTKIGGMEMWRKNDREENALVPVENQALTPQISSGLDSVRESVLRRIPGGNFMRNAIDVWVEKNRDDAQIEVIRKKTELAGYEKECADAIYELWESEYQLVTFEENKKIDEMRLDMEKRRLELDRMDMEQAAMHKNKLNDYEFMVEMKAKEVEWLDLLRRQTELLNPRDKEVKDNGDKRIEDMQRIKKQILAMQNAKEELMQEAGGDPIKAAELVDIYMRTLIEEGVFADVD